MVSVVGFMVSLLLLMWLAYRGFNVLILAPVLALLAVLIGGDTRLLGTYTQIFMTGLGGYLMKYFPLFLLGAIFGRLMEDSGSAEAIARAIVRWVGVRRAILAIVLSTAILTYGGVSVFVVVFAVYPIATVLFREAQIPKRLFPGAFVLGAATFTMSALPGTPSIQNAIPMPFFGTDLYAAPGLGVLGGVIMLVCGMLWLERRARQARESGEGYGEHPHDAVATLRTAQTLPSLVLAITPVLLVIAVNYIFTRFVIPSMDTSYLSESRFGKVTLSDVRGLWALIAAVAIAIVGTIGLHWSRLTDLRRSLNAGTMTSLLPIFNTASEVGYGTVIASLAGFAIIRDAVFSIAPGAPLISEAIAVNVLAGITGSASGGLSIAMASMGATFLQLGTAAGVSPELLHRVAAIASGGLDTLPHNGAVITLLGICHLTHRESYKDIFVVSLAVPLLALVVVVAVGTWVGSF